MLLLNKKWFLVGSIFLFSISFLKACQVPNQHPYTPLCPVLGWAIVHQQLLQILEINDEDDIRRCEIDITDDNGNTLLMRLASEKPNDITKSDQVSLILRLVGYGADVNAQNNQGDTALIKAVENDADLALELLNLHADPDKTNNKGQTVTSLVQEALNIDLPLPYSVFAPLNRFVKALQEHKKMKCL